MPLFAALALVTGGPTAATANAQTPIDPVSRTQNMPFSDIKKMVDRQVGGRMIGGEYDKASGTYQLRYMRGTELIDVVVDARTGQILGRRESM